MFDLSLFPISQIELENLLKSASKGGVHICWVPISASLYKYSDLSKFQAGWEPLVLYEGGAKYLVRHRSY